jgi:tetratricopeptide (TPR) repeat protein
VLIPLIVLVLTAAVYVHTCGFEFVYDDNTQIVQGKARFHLSAIPNYFRADVWGPLTFVRTNYYRPIFLIWLMLNYQLWGLSPELWHASVIGLHLLTTLLLYFLAARVSGDRAVSGLAALLFGVHPVHAEAVAWVSGATEPLVAVLGLGSLLCYLRHNATDDARVGKYWYGGSLGLFFLAVFAKETALVFPILIAAFDWIFFPKSRVRTRLESAFKAACPFLAIELIYLLARVAALKSLTPAVESWPLVSVAATAPRVIVFYLHQLVWPARYVLFHPLAAPVNQLASKDFVTPALLVLGVAVGLWRVCRRSAAGSFGLCLLCLPLAPVLNLHALGLHEYAHDRYLYLPSTGFCLLAALGLGWPCRGRLPVLAGAGGVIAAGLCISTILTTISWKSNLHLFSRSAEVSPDSPTALEYYGNEMRRQGRCGEAIGPLKRVLASDLENANLTMIVGGCLFELGEYRDAVGYFEQACRLRPKMPESYMNLAMVESRTGRLADAELHMRQALWLRPGPSPVFDHYHARLAEILVEEGNLQDAIREYESERAENPEEELISNRLLDLRSRAAVQFGR